MAKNKPSSQGNRQRDLVHSVNVDDIRCWGEEKFKSAVYSDLIGYPS